MSYLQTKVLTHRQAVLRLYRAALKNLKNFSDDTIEWRYECVVMRARFDKNKDIKDERLAADLLALGQIELKNHEHPQPYQFPNCPGGVAFNREPLPNDSIMDTWHPLEKAQFPDYFTRRWQLKKDYIDWYVKKYGIKGYNEKIEGHAHTLEEAKEHEHGHGHHKHH